jgi:hypothetical protein
MLRRMWDSLPGSTPVKAIEAALILVVVLVVLAFAFEYLGRMLDDGGVIG